MPILLPGNVLLSRDWCDIYGDDINGAKRILGGLETRPAWKQWYCPTHSVGKFRFTCAHGHKGQIMKLCAKHYKQYGGGKVQFCPRCNIPPADHKCTLTLESI